MTLVCDESALALVGIESSEAALKGICDRSNIWMKRFWTYSASWQADIFEDLESSRVLQASCALQFAIHGTKPSKT